MVIDKNKIKEEAKKIMDNFMEELSKVGLEDEEYDLKREDSYREEGEGEELNVEFKNMFLKNAPKTSGDAILSVKGSWVKKNEK